VALVQESGVAARNGQASVATGPKTAASSPTEQRESSFLEFDELVQAMRAAGEGGEEVVHGSALQGGQGLGISQLLRPWVVDFVAKVLVARGVAKAIAVRHGLRAVGAHFADVASSASAAYKALVAAADAAETSRRACQEDDRRASPQHTQRAEGGPRTKEQQLAWEAQLRIEQRRDRHLWTLETLAPALADLAHWVHNAAAAKVGNQQLFVAGDGAGALVVPDGFLLRKLLQCPRRLADEYMEKMHAVIAQEGWPPPSRALVLGGSHPCTDCRGTFSRAFATRGLCVQCEAARRAAGVCPFGGLQQGKVQYLRITTATVSNSLCQCLFQTAYVSAYFPVSLWLVASTVSYAGIEDSQSEMRSSTMVPTLPTMWGLRGCALHAVPTALHGRRWRVHTC
jgi:hypothetical protein